MRRKLAVILGWTEILKKKTFSIWIKKDLFQQNHSILQPVLSPASSPQSVVAQCNQLSYIFCVCIVLFNICPADQDFSFQDRTSTRNSNRSVSTAAINSLQFARSHSWSWQVFDLRTFTYLEHWRPYFWLEVVIHSIFSFVCVTLKFLLLINHHFKQMLKLTRQY